jgi:uncharacterized protein
MKMAGILSDTHLSSLNDRFIHQCAYAFKECDTIFHAADLMDLSILSAFKGKDVHAVSGNMCGSSTKLMPPEEKLVVIDKVSIGVTHRIGPRHNIEGRLFALFPTADCIIYGHTHIPACYKFGGILFVNPVSFQGTGQYGSAGTYALLNFSDSGIQASLHTLSPNL